MTTALADQDFREDTPILVQRATGLPTSNDGWETVPWAIARNASPGLGAQFGHAQLDLAWGQICDTQAKAAAMVPADALAMDDLIRIITTTVVDGVPEFDRELFVGVISSITYTDATTASVTLADPGILLAKVYCTRGWEKQGAFRVNPGFTPPFNAIPGGDRSAAVWPGSAYYIHDRTGAGDPWTAHQIADHLLRCFMDQQLNGAAVGGPDPIPWRLDPNSVGDYTPDLIDPDGRTIADICEELFNPRRGLTWRRTTAAGYFQILVCETDATATNLDTEDDLAYTDAQVEQRRDGYDYILVTGDRPHVAITLWYLASDTHCPLIPDGWDPATASTVVDAAINSTLDGQAYDQPHWRRFKINPLWDGSQWTPSGGSSTIGLRNLLYDDTAGTPPNGVRTWSAPIPSPLALTFERQTPAGLGWTADPLTQRQGPIVIAGAAGRWEDLSDVCRPNPLGGGIADRSDQQPGVLLLGDTADDAARLRDAVGTGGQILVTIGVREWAPLQAAWAATLADRATLAPRVYRLRKPGLEEWLCLNGCVTGVDSSGNLTTLTSELAVRSDVAKLRTLRDQLQIRFGAAVTAASITHRGIIDTTWDPGDPLGLLTLGDGRSYQVDLPLVELTWDFTRYQTVLRWANILTEKPTA